MDARSSSAEAPKLLAQARELARLGLVLVEHWPVVEIAELYEQLDNLTSTAERDGAEAIVNAALELTVYLSSLVESSADANPAQRERTRALLRRLAAASGLADSAEATAAASPRVSGHRVVYYLRADDREIPGLVQQLVQESFVTRSFSDLARAIAETRVLPPHALVIDEGFAPGLGKLIEAGERAGGEDRRRPLALALCQAGDVRRRLFAQRAGADAVLEDAHALQVVERLMALFLRQSRDHARVLIIDDDASTAMFCANVLGYKRLSTRIEHCARAGLDAISEFKPDLVLLDLYMPDMNGIEVAQLIRERPDMLLTPIIFMSGEEDIDKRFDAIRMGGDDFLAKPIRPRHLLASVTSRLGRLRKAGNANAGVDVGPDLRSGRVDRATLVHEIERARRGEFGDCVGLIMLSVDDVPALAKRLGFVRTGDLAQQIGTTIASEPALRTGVCMLGEFSFISLLPASSEAALHIAGENLRARLSGRGWLAADASVRVSFSLGGARADVPGLTVDELFGRVSDAVRAARDRTQGRSEWVASNRNAPPITPEVRLAHAILRRPLIAETTEFRFRALVPLRGQLLTQFLADFALVAPKATQAMRIERALFEPIARSLNVVRAIDRWQAHVLAARACAESATMPELRVVLPLTVDSLLDPAFPQWLGADLHGLHCDPDTLALAFDVGQLVDNVAQATRALDTLQTTGVRVFLFGFTDFGREQKRLCCLPSIYGVMLPWLLSDAHWPDAREQLIAEALRNGKIVVVTGVDDPRPLGELFRNRVHYVIGDAVATWHDQMTVPHALDMGNEVPQT